MPKGVWTHIMEALGGSTMARLPTNIQGTKRSSFLISFLVFLSRLAGMGNTNEETKNVKGGGSIG